MPPPPDPLDDLLRNSTQLWRGKEMAKVHARSTGYALLDARLPGGGWPLGSLIEVVPECVGLGELRLVLPALKAWCQEGKNVALVQPPHVPYPPALARHGLPLNLVLWVVTNIPADALWAAEQLLREGAAAVLIWNSTTEDKSLRRLQLAAEAGKACAFLYRSPGLLNSSSPAAIRIKVSAFNEDEVCLTLAKVRGGHPCQIFVSLTT